MDVKHKEYFSSRLGLILSMLGVAIGAGNIWRFSRVVAQNGGGSFIIPWVIFLFIWSIPLIIAELAMGKMTRKAPIGALATTGGRAYGWMGAFIALVTTGILFYYSVVVGWGFRYFLYSIFGSLNQLENYQTLWQSYTTSLQPLLTHLAAVLISCWIIYYGVVRGIERCNKILMPTLFLMIIVIFIRAMTLTGAEKGIQYLFTPNFKDLLNYKIWIEALTQNAFDTGAGWGLLLVYAGYMHRKESVTINGCLTAFGNNAISLLMGMTIFATVFALEQQDGLQKIVGGEGSTNTGLAFIYLPKLFQQLPGGSGMHTLFSTMFFLAFSFAALSSMISMMQLTSQTLNELGIPRKKAILYTGLGVLFFGAPSALSMAVFDNQDWVWSLGLILNGLFIALSIRSFGVNRFRMSAINTSPQDFKLGMFYNIFIRIIIPAQAIFLIFWYFYQSITKLDAQQWWNPLRVFSVGTILLQWGLGVILFILLNNRMVTKTLGSTPDE